MVLLRCSTLLTIANILIPAAILVFAIGFFPYKPFLPGLARFDQDDYATQPNAPFDKVIFMVVDALRSDFVYAEETGFAFVQNLISEGAAMPFTAHATSPTITMPRIKAITTGSTPSFLDLILNFAESDTSSSLATQDTWLAQMKAKDSGKLIMFGDDTWLKLFPQTFDRADGTSSFFVADFTEVDNNVTRNVPGELLNSDWNTMVLHYLGLDHIGHKAGPKSPNMIPKQTEMDGIVKQIYESMEHSSHLSSTLLVLAGDHGMNDAGNHGGSAAGETSPALVFASPKFKTILPGQKCPLPVNEDFKYYSMIEQSDIAPTLSGLLGFPVPKNNLGAFIIDFLPFWPNRDDQIQILVQNARQILNIITATSSPAAFEDDGVKRDCGNLSGMDRLACDWVVISRRTQMLRADPYLDAYGLLQELSKWTKEAGELMSSTASNYAMTNLIAGPLIAFVALVCGLVAALPTLLEPRGGTLPFFALTILYGVLMFASSFVEEEHHFWYWTASGWLLYLGIKNLPRLQRLKSFKVAAPFFALLALRIIRRWAQTGQKFAGADDISHTFLSVHPGILWTLVILTYVHTGASLVRKGFPGVPAVLRIIVAVVLVTAGLWFKVGFTVEDAPELLEGMEAWAWAWEGYEGSFGLVGKARVVFAAGGVCAICAGGVYLLEPQPSRRVKEGTLATFHHLLTLTLLTQTRTLNIPLFLLFSTISTCLSSMQHQPLPALSLTEITITTILLQHVSFFAAGGTNAISSIDLSLAYNGISGFNVVAVGLLVFLGNWAGAVWWGSQAAGLLVGLQGADTASMGGDGAVRARGKGSSFEVKAGSSGGAVHVHVQQQHLALLTAFVAAHLVFVMVACTMLRTHLFIWTVFSPKFLYSMAWSLGVHFLVNLGLGSGLFRIGTGGKA